jgi:hypothetical protein
MMVDRFLYSFRKVAKRSGVMPALRTVRLMVLFGPWRPAVRWIIALARPPQYQEVSESDTFIIDADDQMILAKKIRKNSATRIGKVPDSILRDIRSVTDRLPVEQYQKIHEIDPNIKRIVDDPGLKNLLRHYFRAEPVLLECTLMVTGSENLNQESSHTLYHYDYATWDFLNMFIYLTDVTDNSAYHEVIESSHGRKKLSDLSGEPKIIKDEAIQRFGVQVTRLKGPAGTMFLENTEAFHRRVPSSERRVMLNVIYASCPDALSKGRGYVSNIRKRDQEYAKLRPRSGSEALS